MPTPRKYFGTPQHVSLRTHCEEYRKSVTELANKGVSRRFLNDSKEHAKLLADLMIGRAKDNEEILIYSGQLEEPCFNDALRDSRGPIRIVLESDNELSVLEKLPEEAKGRIEARVLNPGKARKNHFFVVGSSFRLELDHGKATAMANFNEPKAADQLRKHFEQLWEQAEAFETEF